MATRNSWSASSLPAIRSAVITGMALPEVLVGWVSEQGISCRRGLLLDHGSAYRSGDWQAACQALALKPIRSKALTPQTNGTADMVHQDTPGGVGRPDRQPDIRRTNRWQPRDLGIDHSQGCFMALAGFSPHQSRYRLQIAV